MIKQLKKVFKISRLLLFTLLLSTVISPLAQANPFFVSNTGNNANDGLSPATAFATIQNAVSVAAPGDTINVAAGLYSEAINVNKTLTLLGAQAGVDARDRTGNPAEESILSFAGAGPSYVISLSANNIILDGFTIQDAAGGSFYALFTNANFSGYQIINNFIQDNVMGLYLNAGGASQTQVQFNVFQNNGQPGPARFAIYTDQGSDNVLVDSNEFLDNLSCGVNFTSFGGNLAQNIDITNNNFNNTVTGVCLAGVFNALVENNLFIDGGARAIDFNGDNDGVVVRENMMSGHGVAAIRFRNLDNPPPFGPNTNVEITDNQIIDNAAGFEINVNSLTLPIDIHYNRIFNNRFNLANVPVGLLNLSDVIPNAENNWWGCNEGPLGGTDCDVIGTYTFDPMGPTLIIFPNAAVADAEPWLVLQLLTDPVLVLTTESATLTGDLTTNSEGSVPPDNLPNETPINFTTTEGSLSPESTLSESGQGSSAHTSLVAGEKNVCVQVDNEEVCEILTVSLESGITPPVEQPGLPEDGEDGLDTSIFGSGGCQLGSQRMGSSSSTSLALGLTLFSLFSFYFYRRVREH